MRRDGIVYFVSRRSYHHIEGVVDIVEAAERGDPLPPVPDHREKGFGHISYTILRTFVEHKYMTVQLSERKYRQRTLELLALHSQLNPHFLFNTLETINWKTIQVTGHPGETNEMINKLGNVLKYALESPFKLETFSREITQARDYLSIQEIRYKNRFDVRWSGDDGIDHYRTIRFLLQPLLENAIYHGIREAPGHRSIEITMEKCDGLIRIAVADDGVGMSAPRLLEVRSSLRATDFYTENIGLYNTNKRIQLAFGDEYGLKVDSVAGEGTVVAAWIPATL